MLKLIGAASAPNLFEKTIGFPGEGAAAQMQNEQGLGRPIHSFHKLCGDLTLEKLGLGRFVAVSSRTQDPILTAGPQSTNIMLWIFCEPSF